VGKIGRIKEIRPGTVTRRKMVDLDIEGVLAELPADMIIAIGDDKPLVTVTGSE
jgi:ribosomal protein S4E